MAFFSQIVASESVCYAADRKAFLAEEFRLLPQLGCVQLLLFSSCLLSARSRLPVANSKPKHNMRQPTKWLGLHLVYQDGAAMMRRCPQIQGQNAIPLNGTGRNPVDMKLECCFPFVFQEARAIWVTEDSRTLAFRSFARLLLRRVAPTNP